MSFVKGERWGWLEISDIVTGRILSPSGAQVPFSSQYVSVFVFNILVQTEIALLPLRSGLRTDESSPLRRSLLSAREQALLRETGQNELKRADE